VGQWEIVARNTPFRAPKQEKATMKAKTLPPMGPSNARPKSMATVLLMATVFWNMNAKSGAKVLSKYTPFREPQNMKRWPKETEAAHPE
jgi:hypothetical protein